MPVHWSGAESARPVFRNELPTFGNNPEVTE